MVDPSPDDLNFGHFGAPTYSLDECSWKFTRHPRRQDISFLTPWSTINNAAIQHTTPNLLRPARRVHKAVREIARGYAHLTPASEHLAELETVSAATIHASRKYDATLGSLLAFGSITCKGHSDHRPKPVTAMASGEGGNILQLQVIEKVYYGSDHGICLEGPLLGHGEQGFWNEDAAPIRQICFAKAEDHSTFLAVRLPQRTVLLHPTYVHDCKAPKPSRYFDLPTAAIDACPIYSISKEATGGSPHADVAFNPEYQRQLAIVDECGQWSIWDIDDGYRTSNFSLRCSILASSTSQLAGDTKLQAQPNGCVGDGWARIFWCGDANTVVIADRRCVTVVGIKGGLTALKSPDFISARSADWILDMQKHPGSFHHFFVLTSTRLFLVGVTCLNDEPTLAYTDIGAIVLFSWTHFRGADDTTLQLSVHISLDEECVILIYSRLNKLITRYSVQKPKSIIGSQWHASDPVSFTVDNLGDNVDHIIQLHQENLQCKGSGPEGTEKSTRDRDHAIQFRQLTALMSDLSVHQTIFSTEAMKGVNTSPIGPISWSKTIKRQHCHLSSRLDDSTVDSDFVAPDGPVGLKEPVLKRPYQRPKSVRRQPTVSTRHVLDFRPLYKSLLESTVSPNSLSGTTLESVDVSVVIQEVERLVLETQASAEPLLGTLLEFAGMEITVSDVDESSIKLLESSSSERPQSALTLQRTASGHILGLTDNSLVDLPTIASVYDGILNNWIAPLPGDISARVRQRKERIARRIAAEVLLAGLWLRPNAGSPQAHTESHPTYSQDSAAAFSRPTSQQPQPVPLSSQPSSSLPDLHNDAIAESTPASARVDPLSRLSRNLRIERILATSVPPSTSRLLSHWQPNTDPKTFHWEPTESDNLEERTQDDESSHEQREKAKRRRERREKRQQRENERFRATAISQVLPLRSSPGPLFGAGAGLATSSQVLTTSQTESQGLGVQSQVEPGKHGGRPLLLKKKKGRKRVGGF